MIGLKKFLEDFASPPGSSLCFYNSGDKVTHERLSANAQEADVKPKWIFKKEAEEESSNQTEVAPGGHCIGSSIKTSPKLIQNPEVT